MNPSYKPYEQSPEVPHSDSESGAIPEFNTGNNKLQSEKTSQISELPGTHIPLPVQVTQSNTQLPSTPPPFQGASTSTPQQDIGGIALPDAAMDDDLIEAEWVSRARAIVDKNRENPHNQNKEMNKMKAAYIKKRYNKDIKVEEE